LLVEIARPGARPVNRVFDVGIHAEVLVGIQAEVLLPFES
jgi:hypothetical protein